MHPLEFIRQQIAADPNLNPAFKSGVAMRTNPLAHYPPDHPGYARLLSAIAEVPDDDAGDMHLVRNRPDPYEPM